MSLRHGPSDPAGRPGQAHAVGAKRNERFAAAIASALMLFATGGCAVRVPMQENKPSVLASAPGERYTDEVVEGDWRAIAELSAYLVKRESGMDAYTAHKARFLIEFATDEYHENDRSGVTAWALNTANALVEAPTSHAQHALALQWPPRGPHDSIGLLVDEGTEWNILLQAQRRVGDLPCAAELLARYEIGLIRLAHERWEVAVGLQEPGHERAALERVAARRTSLETLLETAAPGTCTPQSELVAPPPRPPVAERPPEPPPAPQHVRERRELRHGNVLFQYDGYTRAELLPGATEMIENLAYEWRLRAERLAQNGLPPPLPIRLNAHADRIGSASYNHRLAWRRAQTVKTLLVENGIPSDRLGINVIGSAQPFARCDSADVSSQLIDCLAPDRRVEIVLPLASLSSQRSTP